MHDHAQDQSQRRGMRERLNWFGAAHGCTLFDVLTTWYPSQIHSILRGAAEMIRTTQAFAALKIHAAAVTVIEALVSEVGDSLLQGREQARSRTGTAIGELGDG